MVLIGLTLVVLLGVIWWLTGGRRGRFRPVAMDDRQAATQVLALSKEAPKAQADVLFEMLTRLGLDDDLAQTVLQEAGLSVDRASRQASRRPFLSVVRRSADLEQALAEALLIGIQVARMDDDYARVGDDYHEEELLMKRLELAEQDLFGEGVREQYALFGKAALVLQDMLHHESDAVRRQYIVDLLGVFDARLKGLQQNLDAAMARVPDVEGLLWGDSRDRRLYYFKMGVTNALRRTGHLKSLRHLYKLQGVNYNVEEAFQLAAEECPALALAERAGIDYLIHLGAAEVQGFVQRALPDEQP